jgi:hypothetical protein
MKQDKVLSTGGVKTHTLKAYATFFVARFFFTDDLTLYNPD